MPYALKMFVLTDSLMCLPRCGCRLNICQQLLRWGSLQLACSQIEKSKAFYGPDMQWLFFLLSLFACSRPSYHNSARKCKPRVII